MTQKLTIAIAQLNFLVGDIDGNAERIIQETNRIAKQHSVDMHPALRKIIKE